MLPLVTIIVVLMILLEGWVALVRGGRRGSATRTGEQASADGWVWLIIVPPALCLFATAFRAEAVAMLGATWLFTRSFLLHQPARGAWRRFGALAQALIAAALVIAPLARAAFEHPLG